MNYCDADIPFTRITEFSHFTPWEDRDETVVFREFSRSRSDGDIPYYPLRLANDTATLHGYLDLADREQAVTFLGRLGTYRYLDMDVCIAEALDAAARYLGGEARPMYATVRS